MIFYTLLSLYPNVDKANIVLTAMILYIIIYIGISDDYNYIVLIVISMIDLSLKFMNLNTFNPFNPFALFQKSKSKKSKSKTSKTSKSNKSKKVRFATQNQYRTYDPWAPGSFIDQQFSSHLNSGSMNGGGYGMGSTGGYGMGSTGGSMGGYGMGGYGMGSMGGYGMGSQMLQIPQMVPLPRVVPKITPTPTTEQLIDNRHMAIKDSDSEDDADSIASDESSDLSNSEEEY